MTLCWVESEKSVEIIGLLPGCPPAPSYCPALYLHPPHLELGPGPLRVASRLGMPLVGGFVCSELVLYGNTLTLSREN